MYRVLPGLNKLKKHLTLFAPEALSVMHVLASFCFCSYRVLDDFYTFLSKNKAFQRGLKLLGESYRKAKLFKWYSPQHLENIDHYLLRVQSQCNPLLVRVILHYCHMQKSLHQRERERKRGWKETEGGVGSTANQLPLTHI